LSVPIKILFVIDSLSFGGAERQLAELIKGLSQKGDYDIHLACLLDASPSYSETVRSTGVPIRFFPRKSKWDLLGPVYALRKYIRKHGIQLVHGFMNMGSLMGALAGKSTGIPVISSAIRDAKDQNFKIKITKQFICRISDICVANSQAGLRNRFPRILPKHRVVYNGIDLDRFNTKVDKLELRRQLGIDQSHRVILCVASLSTNKDHDTLLDAFRLVSNQKSHSTLLLVGDGPERERLERLTSRLKLEAQVRFAGFREDVDKIYNIADLCVLTTNNKQHEEGIANALVEAMASHTPIVAYYGGGTIEFVDNQKNGLLVDAGDTNALSEAIFRLLNNTELAVALADAGLKTIKRLFELETYVQSYEKLYREVITLRH
jgi:glycosyltransferase involved in cell wall biosynthesis